MVAKCLILFVKGLLCHQIYISLDKIFAPRNVVEMIYAREMLYARDCNLVLDKTFYMTKIT
jgi:hypothetical protein